MLSAYHPSFPLNRRSHDVTRHPAFCAPHSRRRRRPSALLNLGRAAGQPALHALRAQQLTRDAALEQALTPLACRTLALPQAHPNERSGPVPIAGATARSPAGPPGKGSDGLRIISGADLGREGAEGGTCDIDGRCTADIASAARVGASEAEGGDAEHDDEGRSGDMAAGSATPSSGVAHSRDPRPVVSRNGDGAGELEVLAQARRECGYGTVGGKDGGGGGNGNACAGFGSDSNTDVGGRVRIVERQGTAAAKCAYLVGFAPFSGHFEGRC